MPLSPGLVRQLHRILGPDGLVLSREGRLVYESDMHTFYKGAPDAVALPLTTGQVQAVVRLCRSERVPIGVLVAVEGPVYEQIMLDQEQKVISERGPGDIAKLLTSGDTWRIS